MLGVPQLSVAVTVAAAGTAVAQATVCVAGIADVNTGAILSFTMINCVVSEIFPHESIAVQVLSNLKFCTQVPSVFVSENVMLGVPQLSVAVTVQRIAGAAFADQWAAYAL